MSYSKGIAKGLGAAMVGFGLISVILGIISVVIKAHSAFNCNWFAIVSGSIVIVAGILGFVSGKMADSKGSMVVGFLAASIISILINLACLILIVPGTQVGMSRPEGKTWAVWIPSSIFAFFEMVIAMCCCILCLESMVGYFTKREPGPVLYKDEQATMLPADGQEAVQVEEEAEKTK
ncbi:hypothetical protein Bbelb_351440 [Branchiostoma belcheri]|nr:hypothetical protein Bbelb_351440 [Branchiostoma belcheri]